MAARAFAAAFSCLALGAVLPLGLPSGAATTAADSASGPGKISIIDLGTMGEAAGAAVDLNDHNTVVGNVFDPDSHRSTPVGWFDGEGRPLGYGAHENGRMLQVNDKNLAIGTLDSGPGVTHAVYWDHHGQRNVLRPDGQFSAAIDLSHKGEVLLWYSLADGSPQGSTDHAAIWHKGKETPILPVPSDPGVHEPGGQAGFPKSPGADRAADDLEGRLRPVALNNHGQVAITAEGADGAPVGAYHWASGQLTGLGSLGGGGTTAAAIDKYGRIAGTSLDEHGRERAFIWKDGEMHDLGTLGGNTSQVVDRRGAMSEVGHVIGTSEDAAGRLRAFLWKDGEMRDLGTLGGGEPQPVAVNASGHVAGYDSTEQGRQHAFFWDGEQMLDLGTLGGEMSRAYALNNRGEVAGVSITADGAHHATFWTVR